MRIELAGLKMPHQVEAELENLDLSGFARTTHPIHLRAVISGDADLAIVDGEVKGEVLIGCSRCLEDSVLPLRTRFHLKFLAREAFAVGDNRPLTGDELESDEIVDGYLDFESIVREQVILMLPNQHLCSEECAGLCVLCGANLNLGNCGCDTAIADPRWDELRKLI